MKKNFLNVKLCNVTVTKTTQKLGWGQLQRSQILPGCMLHLANQNTSFGPIPFLGLGGFSVWIGAQGLGVISFCGRHQV